MPSILSTRHVESQAAKVVADRFQSAEPNNVQGSYRPTDLPIPDPCPPAKAAPQPWYETYPGCTQGLVDPSGPTPVGEIAPNRVEWETEKHDGFAGFAIKAVAIGLALLALIVALSGGL